MSHAQRLPCLRNLASRLKDVLRSRQNSTLLSTGGRLHVSATAKGARSLPLTLLPNLGGGGHANPLLAEVKGSVWRFLSRKSAVSKSTPDSLIKSRGSVPTGPRPQRPSFLRPVLFCVTGSVAAFTFAAAQEESRYRREWERFKSRPIFERRPRGAGDPAWLADLPAPLQNLYREFWGNVQPKQRVVGAIIALNLAVFVAMQRPSLQGFMYRNFVHCLPPLPLRTITLLTSNFAHGSGMHLAFNMIAFWSFGREAGGILGPDQFLGFYLSAGLASALMSHLGRFRSLAGGLSLGASGAVYACFALTAITKPDTQVALIFLPMLPFSIADALNVMILVDLTGVLLGWRRFDHFGHLGGALFGLYWAFRGQYDVWPKFQSFAESLRQDPEEGF